MLCYFQVPNMSDDSVFKNNIHTKDANVSESVNNINIIVNNYNCLVESQIPSSANVDNCTINMSENKTGVRGVMKLSEALDNMSLAYNPITKQLHFVSPKVDKRRLSSAEIIVSDSLTKKESFSEPNCVTLSKKDSFSDEGNYSLSTCDKSDSDSPKGTLRTGHQRSKDGGSFSSTISSLSEYSLSGSSSKEDAVERVDDNKVRSGDDSTLDDPKFKKKGFSAFFSRGVFPWKSGGAVETSSANLGNSSATNGKQQSTEAGWRFFGRTGEAPAPAGPTPCSSVANTPQHHQNKQHRRQGSTASEDLVASSIALIQHDRPSNLPAKCSAEADRHRLEHERMVALARRRGEREAALRRARHADVIRHEDAVTRAAHEWNATILPDWDNMKSAKRTKELWWCGLPPSVRGRVWQLAIGNQLNVTTELYHKCVESAKLKLEQAKLRRQKLKIHKSPHNQNTQNGKVNCKHHDVNTDNSRNETNVTENGLEHMFNDMKYGLQIHSGSNPEQKRLENCNESNLRSSCKKIDINEGNTRENGIDEMDHYSSNVYSHSIHNQTSLHRNFSEQNFKSKCTDCSRGSLRENSRSSPNMCELGDEGSMELIELDIARTFPHLCIFQPGGPYFDVLHELLAAYVCYRPDIGYVQGMSFLAAILILNMEAAQAFVCFANLMNGPVLKAAFTRDGASMQRLWSVYEALLQANVPSLAGRVAPELYLLEWLYTAFAKAMPLDAACHVWDVFLRDGDHFLFRAALGVLHLYQDTLVEMDFIAAAQFLTKLPEDLSSEALFRSIAQVQLQLCGRDFVQLVDTYSGPATTLQLDEEEVMSVEDL